MIAYKVLNRSFKSATETSYELQYEVGKITYPTVENSRIFVFKRLRDAKRFMDAYFGADFSIWRVEVPELTIIHTVSFYSSEIPTFWKENFQGIESKSIIAAPRGSYTTPWVKLLKKIQTP